MLGPKTGVARRIQEVAPKAHPTHRYAHSLSLSVKDMTCNCQLLSQTMDIAKEIVTLIKFSPKRESLEWDVCFSERLQPDVRARIIGCKAQMERFDFFFGLHLGEAALFPHR